mgnify:CR=1 FL=1
MLIMNMLIYSNKMRHNEANLHNLCKILNSGIDLSNVSKLVKFQLDMTKDKDFMENLVCEKV